MYLRAIFCTFQISVDFYFVPVGGRGGAGEGEGARERGIVTINVPVVYMGRYEVVLRGDYP
jgi:hypothetical protein